MGNRRSLLVVLVAAALLGLQLDRAWGQDDCDLLGGRSYYSCHYRKHYGRRVLRKKFLGLPWLFSKGRSPVTASAPAPAPAPVAASPSTAFTPMPLTTRPAFPPTINDQQKLDPVPSRNSSRAVAVAIPVTALVTLIVAVAGYFCYRKFKTPRLAPDDHRDDKPLLFTNISGGGKFQQSPHEHRNPVPGFPVTGEGTASKLEQGRANHPGLSAAALRTTSLPASIGEFIFDGGKTTAANKLPPLPPPPLASPRQAPMVKPFVQMATKLPTTRTSSSEAAAPPPSSPTSSAPPLILSTSPDAPSRERIPKPLNRVPNAVPSGAATPPPPPPPPPGAPRPPPPPAPPPPPPPPLAGPRPPAPPPPLPAGGLRPPAPPPPPPPGVRPPAPPPPLPAGMRPPPAPPGVRPPPLPGKLAKPPPKLTVDTVPSSSEANKGQKLKPLFWDKIKANPDHSMVWDNLASGSFRLDEDMIEALFGVAPAATEKSKPAAPAQPKKEQLIDSKRAHNIAIQIRALGLTRQEIRAALLEGDGLGLDALEALSKMAPGDDEERRLRNFKGSITELGTAEQFLLAMLKVPFAFQRVRAMLYKEQFAEELSHIQKCLRTFKTACVELRNSRSFKKLLQVVLMTGNKMNMGTYRGDAQAFKLNTLLKLSDVKSVDGKMTLLQFIVQEVIRAEGLGRGRSPSPRSPARSSFVFDNKQVDFDKAERQDMQDEFKQLGTQVILGMNTELENVKKASSLDIDVLKSSVYKLVSGLQSVDESVKALEAASDSASDKDDDDEDVFCEVMGKFVIQAVSEVEKAKEEYDTVVLAVKKLNIYFDADKKKDDATAFQIFTIVSQFLIILERACRDSFNKK